MPVGVLPKARVAFRALLGCVIVTVPAVARLDESPRHSDGHNADREVTIEDIVNAPDSSAADAVNVVDVGWIGASDEVVFCATNDRTHGEVETLNTRDGAVQSIAQGVRPKASPDGNQVAFVAQGSGHGPQIWIHDRSTGRSRQLTRFEGGILSSWSDSYEYSWSPDSSEILVAQHVGAHLATVRGGDRLERFAAGKATAIVIDGRKHLHGETQKTELWLIDAATGVSRLLATEPADFVAGISWLADGGHATFFSQGRNAAEVATTSISILDTRTGATEIIRSGMGQHGFPHVAPDGRYLAFDRNTLGIAYPWHDAVSLLRLDTKRELTLPIGNATSSVLGWSRDSEGLYVREKADSSSAWQVKYRDLAGGQYTIPGLGEPKAFALSPFSGKAAWAAGSVKRPVLVVADLGNHELERAGRAKVERIAIRRSGDRDASGASSPLAQGLRRTVSWRSRDGSVLSGFLELPVNYKLNRRYATLVMVHGGAFDNRGSEAAMPLHSPLVFDYWAAKGYAIFAPNYRSDGSAGWNAFMRARAEGRVLERDLEDIMSGIDEVVRMGVADESRLAILGHSAGSTETNWAITHSHRFRVAVSFEGQGGMIWGLGGRANDYEEWLYGGSPLAKPELYDRQSSARYVAGTTTPTLFIAGEYGLAREQLAWLYAALTRQGTPAAFILYRGEGHNITSAANRQDVMSRVTVWIEQYLQ